MNKHSTTHSNTAARSSPYSVAYSTTPTQPAFLKRNASQKRKATKMSSAARLSGDGVGWSNRGSTGNVGGLGLASSSSYSGGLGLSGEVGSRSYPADDMEVSI